MVQNSKAPATLLRGATKLCRAEGNCRVRWQFSEDSSPQGYHIIKREFLSALAGIYSAWDTSHVFILYSKEQDLFVFIKVLLRNSYIKQDALWRSSKVFLWTLAAYLVIFSLGVVPDHFPRNVVFGVFFVKHLILTCESFKHLKKGI